MSVNLANTQERLADRSYRITFLRDYTTIGAGGETQSETLTIGTVWASIERRTLARTKDAAHLRQPSVIDFACEYRDAFLEATKVLFRSRIYTILTTSEVGRFQRTLLVRCEASDAKSSAGEV